jgi:predicted enzyme related to lactoylglutathione lyase
VIREIQLNIDCADPERLVEFYATALGYQPFGNAGAQYFSVVPRVGAGPKIVFQRVPEAKVAKNRMHLDLVVDDIEAEAERFVALGATRGERVEEHGGAWIVMQDPEGNELCICDS